MRKLIVAEQISLDGVIQSPGSPREDPSGGFRLGGWVPPYADETGGRALQDLLGQPYELLLGRRTYDIWAKYWPYVEKDSGAYSIAEVFNRVPKHVATHRPKSLRWHNSHALKGGIAPAVRTLKRRKGPNLMTWGSGKMVNQLLAAGLVDELWLLLYPVILGRGKRLFDDTAQSSAFRLAKSTRTPTGVVVNHYVRSGKVRTGSFDE